MAESLEDIVERAIDRAIRSFRPDDPRTFEEFDSELQQVETILSSAEPGPNVPDLLARTRAVRIAMAAELGDAEAVVRQSVDFIKTCPATRLDFFNVLTLRLRALHALGRHGDELREALEAAKRPEVRSEDFVLLIEGLAKRHSGRLEPDSLLQKKLSDAIEQLGLAGYSNLPTNDQISADLEQAALDTAAELRRVNEARTRDLLSEYEP